MAEGEERGGFQPKAWGKKHAEHRFWQGSNSVAILTDNINIATGCINIAVCLINQYGFKNSQIC